MPTLDTTAVATVETDVEIAPHTQVRLAAVLSTYHGLKEQYDLLAEQMGIAKTELQHVLEALGLDKVRVDGTPISIVRGTSSSLDKQKFVLLGGSLSMLKEATVQKPKQPYLSIGKEQTGGGNAE